jgi:MFS family permease
MRYAPLFCIESYAIQENIMSARSAFYLLPILNAGSIFGRILPNFFVDKTGALNMYIPCCLVAGILAFAWIAIRNTAGLVVFSVFYGFISGLYLTLPALTAISLSPHLGVVGVRMGMSFSIAAIGFLIGTPIAGAIGKRGWVGLQAYTGATLILSTVIMVAARVSKVGFKITKA